MRQARSVIHVGKLDEGPPAEGHGAAPGRGAYPASPGRCEDGKTDGGGARRIARVAIWTLACISGVLLVQACVDREAMAIMQDDCERMLQCDPVLFADSYESLEDCVDRYMDWLHAKWNGYRAECYYAALDYVACLAEQGCAIGYSMECDRALRRMDGWCSYDEIDFPCAGYIPGWDDDYCCQNGDPCRFAADGICDCGGACTWDATDCG